MNIKHVQDLTGDPSALLDRAFASPKLNAKKSPDMDAALRVVGKTVNDEAVAKLTEEINLDLMEAISMYEINNGEYDTISEEGNARADYESGIDDVVEAALEPWEPMLSADWLGKNTVETQVWLSTDMDRTIVLKLATSAAKEVFKGMTADRTPAQILASAGIVTADIETRLQQNLNGEQDMTNATTIQEVAAKIKTYVGKDFDQLAVYSDVETICEEDDDILCNSAAARLGLNEDDVAVVQMATLDLEDAPTEIVALVDDYKIPSGRANTKAAKAEKAQAKAEEAANGIATEVFEALKECGAGDTAMAEALGVSRSTYGNYVKGKTHLVPEQEQYDLLRGEIVERTNKLLSALAALDGTELTQVA